MGKEMIIRNLKVKEKKREKKKKKRKRKKLTTHPIVVAWAGYDNESKT